MPYTYEYPRPNVTVDAVIVTRRAPREVLLIRRGHAPFEGRWVVIEVNAVPGWKALAATCGIDVAAAVIRYIAEDER